MRKDSLEEGTTAHRWSQTTRSPPSKQIKQTSSSSFFSLLHGGFTSDFAFSVEALGARPLFFLFFSFSAALIWGEPPPPPAASATQESKSVSGPRPGPSSAGFCGGTSGTTTDDSPPPPSPAPPPSEGFEELVTLSSRGSWESQESITGRSGRARLEGFDSQPRRRGPRRVGAEERRRKRRSNRVEMEDVTTHSLSLLFPEKSAFFFPFLWAKGWGERREERETQASPLREEREGEEPLFCSVQINTAWGKR